MAVGLSLNLIEVVKKMKGPWSSASVATANGVTFRVRAMEDTTAPWHVHDDGDEIFIVLSGTLNVDTEGTTYVATPGGLVVVPRGVRHRARVEGRAELLVLDALNSKEVALPPAAAQPTVEG